MLIVFIGVLYYIFSSSDIHALEQDKLNHESNLLINLYPYQQLKSYLEKISHEKEKNIPKIQETLTLYKQGIHHPDIKIIKTILKEKSYIQDESILSDEEDYYSPELVPIIKSFQIDHNLNDDGVIGLKTKQKLNQGIKDKLRKIVLNLERWRHFEKNLPSRFLVVNIASYEVWIYDLSKTNGQMIPVFTIPAIVGMISRKTPQFTGRLVSVIINPSWGVPTSIAVKDKLRKIQDDPDYLIRNHYTLTDLEGIIVDPYDVEWQYYSHDYFPFRLRQKPGRDNALGFIKFNIDNPYDIYLHGTPDVHLFKKKNRAFSSGCIRLQDPLKLASWVLEGTDYQDILKLQKMIDHKYTQTIHLQEPTPVYFIYITAWIDEKGDLQLSDDPYHLDKE